MDFSEGKIWRNIINQAIPLILAQLVQLLYSVVDRVYLGHLPYDNNMALTGVGLTFPIITLILAFTNLFGMGGVPLFSIARGERDEKRAALIQGNVFSMLLLTGVLLTVICYIIHKPVLYLFGASDASYVYAAQYLNIYLLGTVCSMISAGMNGFINAQGFPKIGMMTTLIGAILNLALDPLFIFALHMNVRGAALATVLSQTISMLWVLRYLLGKKNSYKLSRETMRLHGKLLKQITALGLSGFIVQGTNCMVQVVCNTTLQTYGGDLYVGIMTIINSVREVANLPVHDLTSGSQPVIGFNYGAKCYSRVKQAIRFTAILGLVYTFLFWGLVKLIPHGLIQLFTNDPTVIQAGVPSLNIYFFGFCFMAFQFIGQSTFQALGYAKRAIFFSLLRKAIIVVPLTLLLPRFGLGVNGVFMAEPISNVIGGLACFFTMWYTVYRKLGKEDN